MRRIDLADYMVKMPNQDEQYRLKDGRGPFPSIQECLDALGVAKEGRPNYNRWPELPPELQEKIIPVDTVDIPYIMKDSLVELLFARELNISGPELLERDDLARKIMAADGHVLLEEAEWGKFNDACANLTHFGKPDIEMVRRVMKAEAVEVEEKKPVEEATP
jgi:hypothetical protein